MNRFKLGILLAIAGVFLFQKTFAQLGRHKCDTADFVFMVDYSKSFKDKAWRTVSIISNYIDSLNVDSAAIKIGFNWFDASDHPKYISGNRKDIQEELRYVRTIKPSYGTALTQAFKRLWMMFYRSSLDRERCCNQSTVPRCVVLITDGGMVDYDAALEEANALKASGVLIYVITVTDVGKNTSERLLAIANDNLYFIKTDLDHLEQHLLELQPCSQ